MPGRIPRKPGGRKAGRTVRPWSRWRPCTVAAPLMRPRRPAALEWACWASWRSWQAQPSSSGKRQPPFFGDRQPDNLDRLPQPCPHFPLFRRRQPVPHQDVEHPVREAMRLHDRLGAAVRRASEQPERPALFGAEALWAHRHCTPVRLSRCGCSLQFGRASPPTMPHRVHTMRAPSCNRRTRIYRTPNKPRSTDFPIWK
jgi:hypothetical protein